MKHGRLRRGALLLMGTALGALAGMSPALAADMAAAAANTGADQTLAQARTGQRFDIPAQPLASALTAFAQHTGLRLVYGAGLAEGLTSPGASGEMSSEDALRRLLGGTGLTWRFTDNRTVTIEKIAADGAMTLEPVTVEGQASRTPTQAEIANLPPVYSGGQVARGSRLGILGNRDVMDTPFNQTSYTAQTIADQQARSIADIANNDPSIRASWPSTGYSAPLMIRGFAASNQDVAFNGLYGIMPTMTVAVEMAERVEILKGPSAMLTGMPPNGTVGGAINLVPKRAEDTDITRVTLSYLSDAQFGTHLDVGRRFGTDKKFGVRFNGVYRDGETAVDEQEQEFGAAQLGMDYRGDDLRLSLDLGHQRQHSTAPTLITYVASGLPVPDAPDASSNWFQNWSWVDLEDNYGAARIEYDLNKDWTLFAATGGKDTHFDRLTYFPSVTNAAGDLTATPNHMTYRYLSNTQEAGIRGQAETGPVQHQLTLSATRFHLDTMGAAVSTGSALASNLYNPVTGPRPAVVDFDPPKISEANLTSFAVGDVLSILDERVQLIAGLRHQEVLVHNFSATNGQETSRYDESAVTPTAGLVVKPWRNVSLYGNYIEALQQGAVVGGTYANAGQTLAPYTSKQYEAGVKVDWGDITTTLSAFQITKPSGTAPSATGIFSADGEQRNRGLELNTFGQISPSVRILGGVSLLDPIQTKTANGTTDGKDAPGVPRFQLNMGAEWDTPFLPELTLSGRVIHTGEQYMDNANTQTLPSWTRFDIGARYRLETQGTPITIRANVENLFDSNYWMSSAYGAGWLANGAPRTFLLSTTFDF